MTIPRPARNKFIPVFLLSILITVSCTTPRQTVIDEKPVDSEQVPLELERPIPYPIELPSNFIATTEEGTRTLTGEPGDLYWQNETEYRLKAELIPDENRVVGTVNITFFNNSPDDLQQLVLELTQNLHKAGTMKKENTEITGGVELKTISLDGEPVEELSPEVQQRYAGEMGFLVDATRLLILPGRIISSGERIELEIEWTFIVPEQGASGRMGRSQDNLFFIGYWYPQISVYDDLSGWFTDPFLGNAEFYHGFADYKLEITAPENWLVMATGEFLNPEEVLADRIFERYMEAGESDELVHIVTEADLGAATKLGNEGKLTWKFSAEKVRDVAFSATRESVWDGARTSVGDLDGNGEENFTRIHSFYRQSAPLWEDQVEFAQHSITFLSEYLNHPYPWPHMTSVEGAGIIGGGMEFPMMTVMGSYNNLGSQRLHGVTAHEFAHMWIPMIVSTNERRYSWMDEGFTTFNTHQAMVDAYPGDYDNFDVFQSYLGFAGSDLEGPMMRWSDYHYPGPAFGVASYPKPASVLTALKGLLGDDLFHEAYHTFIEEWSYKHPTPWDFFNTFNRFAETNLEWFWRSWYFETWVLDHAIGDVNDHGNRLELEIQDLGNIPMPVQVLIVLEDGTELIEEVPVDIWLKGNTSTTISVDTGQPTVEIELDPAMHFPDVDRSNNYWEVN